MYASHLVKDESETATLLIVKLLQQQLLYLFSIALRSRPAAAPDYILNLHCSSHGVQLHAGGKVSSVKGQR